MIAALMLLKECGSPPRPAGLNSSAFSLVKIYGKGLGLNKAAGVCGLECLSQQQSAGSFPEVAGCIIARFARLNHDTNRAVMKGLQSMATRRSYP